MSLGSDMILWIEALAADESTPLHDRVNAVGYAPVSRKDGVDGVAIGVIAEPAETEYAFGGGAMESRADVSIIVSDRHEASVQSAADYLRRQFGGFAGELPFNAPDGYGAKTNVLGVFPVSTSVATAEAEGVPVHRLDFEVITS